MPTFSPSLALACGDLSMCILFEIRCRTVFGINVRPKLLRPTAIQNSTV
jgi:hypothetical protein